jgi:peptide deformylase
LLEIVKYPHPALRYVARPVERIDDALRAQVRQMFDLMYEARGIGLAATQVALPLRLFVLNLTADPEKPEEERVFINPQIVKRHSSQEEEEGCLSLPGLYAKVHRARRVRVQAFDLDGNPLDVDADDLLSRALQHETDHLDGKLFIDYIDLAHQPQVGQRVREFEASFHKGQESGTIPDDATLTRLLDALARGESPTTD